MRIRRRRVPTSRRHDRSRGGVSRDARCRGLRCPGLPRADAVDGDAAGRGERTRDRPHRGRLRPERRRSGTAAVDLDRLALGERLARRSGAGRGRNRAGQERARSARPPSNGAPRTRARRGGRRAARAHRVEDPRVVPRRRLLERHDVPRVARLPAGLGFTGDERRRHRHRDSDDLFPQAPGREPGARRRLPPSRQVQGRRGALHPRRTERGSAPVARVDAGRHARGVARRHPNSSPGVAEASVEDGPYTADEARSLHLVDDVGYYDEARDALEKATGAVRAEGRLGQRRQIQRQRRFRRFLSHVGRGSDVELSIVDRRVRSEPSRAKAAASGVGRASSSIDSSVRSRAWSATTK